MWCKEETILSRRYIDDKENKIVEINHIQWKGVEKFLKEYVGKEYQIDQNDFVICIVRFSIPTCDDKGRVTGRNVFQGRMII